MGLLLLPDGRWMDSTSGHGCVLVVEDPLIQRFVSGVLKREAYPIVEAKVEESLRILRSGDLGVVLLITNQPLRYLEFAETLPLLYIAALPEPALALHFRRCRMLRKPFPPADLVECVAELASPAMTPA